MQITNNCIGTQGGVVAASKYELSFCDASEIVYTAADSGLQSVEHDMGYEDKDITAAGSFRKSKQITSIMEAITLNFKFNGEANNFRKQLQKRYSMLASGNANAFGTHLNGGFNLKVTYTYTNGSSDVYEYNNLIYKPDQFINVGEEGETEFSIEAIVPITGFKYTKFGEPATLPVKLLEAFDFKVTGTPTYTGTTLDLSKLVLSSKTINGKPLFEDYSVVVYKADGTFTTPLSHVLNLSSATNVTATTSDFVAVIGHLTKAVNSIQDSQVYAWANGVEYK